MNATYYRHPVTFSIRTNCTMVDDGRGGYEVWTWAVYLFSREVAHCSEANGESTERKALTAARSAIRDMAAD